GGAGGSASPLAASPWFRNLFIEFAQPEDIQRTVGKGGMEGLLEALHEHQKSLGLLDVDESDEDGVEAEEADRVEDDRDVGRRDLEEAERPAKEIAESAEVKILSEVLTRCCSLLATPVLMTQAQALACVRECILKLASTGAEPALLPHVHRVWRPLMSCLREHLTSPSRGSSFPLRSSEHFTELMVPQHRQLAANTTLGTSPKTWEALPARRAVILHFLDTVDCLAGVCGDFLSTKITEDLWPVMKVLLARHVFTAASSGEGGAELEAHRFSGGKVTAADLVVVSPSARHPVRGGGTGGGEYRAVQSSLPTSRARFVDSQVLNRAVTCLDSLCRHEECQLFMTPLARELALLTLPCLSVGAPVTLRQSAKSLFSVLTFLDGDAIWLLLQQTVHEAASLTPNRSEG
ncbi:unnamed protein product, partial [Discosporangium mesarthrocarpum]